MIFLQLPYQNRNVIQTLMISNENYWPAYWQVLFVDEFYCIEQDVIGAGNAHIHKIDNALVCSIAKCIKAYPLYGMKNNQNQSKGKIMDRRQDVTEKLSHSAANVSV